VLGLSVDQGRPDIPGIPGFWVYVGRQWRVATKKTRPSPTWRWPLKIFRKPSRS
jgi:hypothetical protein